MKKVTFLKTALVCALLAGFQLVTAQTNVAPLATVTGSDCWNCPQANDLNINACGSQEMFIWTRNPATDYFQFEWSTPTTTDEVIIHHAQTTSRYLTGATIQAWNGTSFVNVHTFSGLNQANCVNSVSYPATTTTILRFTNLQPGTGQATNMNYREFELIEAVLGANNAAVVGLDSPSSFCPGVENIIARIANRGINQINSVIINWKFNNILQSPIAFTGLLDTNGGTAGPNDTAIFLGTRPFIAGQKDSIEVWTSMPNNVVDTITQDDSAKVYLQPSLAGNFTVDPAGSGPTNYLTISDAISDLNDFGVCGPTRFTVAPGTYTEQMDFGAINGVSATNTVTFVGDTTNSGGVIVQYGASGAADNFVLRFDGSEYVTVNGFTLQNSTGGSTAYRAIFTMQNKASYNTLMNSTIKGYATTSTSQNLAPFWVNSGGNNYNKFMYNDIDANGHYYAVRFYGNSSDPNQYNEFIGNTIRDSRYYGCYIYYHTGTKFRNNTMNSINTSTTGYGVYSYYGYDDVEFTGNKIHWAYYALRIYQHSGSPTSNTLVANNWLVGGDGSYYVYGLYAGYCNFARIVNNTIWKNSSASYGYYGLYLYQGTSNTVVNNLIYDPIGSSSYYGLYINPSSAAGELDYNNVFTSANYGYLNGVRNDLSAWKAAGGGDHSYDYDPAFILTDSLRHCNDSLDNTGTPLPYITDDIDGDLRDAETPDIGADEFVGGDSSSYSAGVDGELCNGQPIYIGAPITGGTYQWSTGSSDSMIMVSTPGTYSVIFTSACGGTFTDAVDVTDITPTASFNTKVSYFSGKFTNTSNNGTTYRWVVNGTDTIWSTDLQYIFGDNGPYEVCLTTYNKCDTVTTCNTWAGSVGIDDAEFGSGISLFPNPSSNNVFIQFNDINADQLDIEMINIQGQVVMSKQLVNINGSGTETLDVSSLNSGVYLVRVISDKGVTTKHLVVE